MVRASQAKNVGHPVSRLSVAQVHDKEVSGDGHRHPRLFEIEKPYRSERTVLAEEVARGIGDSRHVPGRVQFEDVRLHSENDCHARGYGQ